MDLLRDTSNNVSFQLVSLRMFEFLFPKGSKFGGVLDMVTDRVSSCGLLVIVSHLYPTYKLHFNLLIVLDITSHWFHVMSVSAHHKSKEALEHRNALLQWYYSVYPLFGYCCVGTEAFYILLYVIYHQPDPLMSQVRNMFSSLLTAEK